jgi:small-conductance mechanosensitive channel
MTTLGTLGAAAAVVVGFILVLIAMRLLRWTVAVLPLNSSQRSAAGRWVPAAQLLVGIAGFVIVTVIVFGRTPALAVAAVAALLVGGAAWFAIRDVVAGVVLRTEHGLAPGHVVRTDDVAGRIHAVGARSVEIEGQDGRRVRVPYTRLGASPISVAPARESGGALTFTVTLLRRAGRDDIARIRAASMHAFFASARREPHIRVVAENAQTRTYDVTIYAADPAFLPAIEEAVAANLGSAP